MPRSSPDRQHSVALIMMDQYLSLEIKMRAQELLLNCCCILPQLIKAAIQKRCFSCE